MKKILFTTLLFITSLFGHTQSSKYESSKYGYTINIPNGYEQKNAKGIHIDFKVVSQDGSSILVNVSERLLEEKGIDAHSYSKGYFENIFRQNDPNTVISKTEKIIVDGKKAFLIYYSYPTNRGNHLNVVEAYLFVGNNAYVITATADDNTFGIRKNLFIQTIKSIKF